MAAREIAETQAADSSADEFLHFVTDCIKHSADLAVDSLPQDNSQARRLDQMYGIDSRTLAVKHHALMQFRCERRVPRAIEHHFVFLLDLVTRMGETLRQVAVVCEQEETFRL